MGVLPSASLRVHSCRQILTRCTLHSVTSGCWTPLPPPPSPPPPAAHEHTLFRDRLLICLAVMSLHKETHMVHQEGLCFGSRAPSNMSLQVLHQHQVDDVVLALGIHHHLQMLGQALMCRTQEQHGINQMACVCLCESITHAIACRCCSGPHQRPYPLSSLYYSAPPARPATPPFPLITPTPHTPPC